MNPGAVGNPFTSAVEFTGESVGLSKAPALLARPLAPSLLVRPLAPALLSRTLAPSLLGRTLAPDLLARPLAPAHPVALITPFLVHPLFLHTYLGMVIAAITSSKPVTVGAIPAGWNLRFSPGRVLLILVPYMAAQAPIALGTVPSPPVMADLFGSDNHYWVFLIFVFLYCI